MWTPEPGATALWAWWEPLVRLSRRVRQARMAWAVHIDEFELIGRIDRRGRPAIWIYRHLRSRGELFVDDEAVTYRWIPARSGPSAGRFVPADIRRSLFGAGLHEFVDPIWYDHPARDYVEPDDGFDDEDDGDLLAPPTPPPAPPPRRRSGARHLRLVVPGP
jgi:hypothetical protein